MKKIPLQNNGFAIVDEDVWENCMNHEWYLMYSRGINPYVYTYIDGRIVYLHRFVIDAAENDRAGLIDNSILDYRRVNIEYRHRDESAQIAKGRRWSSSKYKGVSWREETQKWRAGIKVDGKQKSLGHYSNEDDAAKAYNAAAVEHFEKGCFLNIIGESNISEAKK